MAIYTKKGDRGETSIFSGKKLPKSSLRIKTIGAVDEVNSFLGMVIAEAPELKDLKEVQRNLFSLGSILAGAPLRFSKAKTRKLEKEIDRVEGKLPVLKNFILPGGGKVGSKLFFARTLVRRAERALVSLNKKEPLKPEILVYINRLSDYLFMVGREVNHKEGIKEEVWRGTRK
jgi:cob(I)alamin adenosyltransferase